jgi:3-oxoadipate enol-lactonase
MTEQDLAWPIRSDRVAGSPALQISRAGSGTPIIFLHGIGGNRSNWRMQLLGMADRFQPVAVDLRGWGESEDYEGEFRMDDVCDDLLRVLQFLGHDRAHWVGLSMGGIVVQHLAHLYPEVMLSMVLADTSSGPADDHDEAWIESFLTMRKAPLIAGASPADIAPSVAQSLAGSAITPDTHQELIASLSALHKESYLKALDTVSRYKRLLDPAKVRWPVLVINGADDRLTTPQTAKRLAQLYGDASVVIIEQAGHLSNLEKPQAFNQALVEFLSA